MAGLLSMWGHLKGLPFSLIILHGKSSLLKSYLLFTQAFHCSTPEWKSESIKCFPQGDLFSKAPKASLLMVVSPLSPSQTMNPHE